MSMYKIRGGIVHLMILLLACRNYNKDKFLGGNYKLKDRSISVQEK